MRVWQRIKEDVLVAFERDPAARSVLEVALCYPGIHALILHRFAHALWLRGVFLPARLTSVVARLLTGVEIHPGATIGRRVFIDHGMGVVIGETAEIGNDVLIYQGVSLGGTSLKKGKRHPTIEDFVVVGLGSTVLGPVTIGRHSRVGAGSVVVASVPPHSTVVGVPGRVVREVAPHTQSGEPLLDLDHAKLPDPVVRAIATLSEQVAKLEQEVSQLRGHNGGEPGRGETREQAREASETPATSERPSLAADK